MAALEEGEGAEGKGPASEEANAGDAHLGENNGSKAATTEWLRADLTLLTLLTSVLGSLAPARAISLPRCPTSAWVA